MIDLHSHILPRIDDGARNLDVSLKMATLYAANGFRQVVATPHALPEDIGANNARALQRRVAEMNQVLRARSIALTLASGMEIAMAPTVPGLLVAGKLLTLAGSHYVLIETPFERLPIHWEQMLFEIAGQGYQVLLAHPERSAQLSRNHGLFDRMIEMGIHLQVNWGSFTGDYGRPALKTARYLARKCYIRCLATDSHDDRARSAAVVGRAAPKITALIGAPNLRLLSAENPGRVMADRPLAPMQCPTTTRRATGGWKRWVFRQG